MKSTKPFLYLSALFAILLVTPASAHSKKELKNLKVLSKDLGKNVSKGMKLLSKGLGVKCTACHVKGEFESDKVPAKEEARKFIKTALENKDGRAAALADLVKDLKLEKVKSEAKIWEGVELWMSAGGEKKAAEKKTD